MGEGTGEDNFILVLSSTIKQGQTFTVDYAVPTTGLRIADTAGNEAVGFTDFEVDNNSIVDGTPTVPSSAWVLGVGDRLTLTFNEDLDIGPGKLPPADAFIVKADGAEVALQSVELSVNLDNFRLTLSSTIGARQIVTVSYAVPATGTVIEDTAGNDALAFDRLPGHQQVDRRQHHPAGPGERRGAGIGRQPHAHLQRGPRQRVGQTPPGQQRSPSRPTASTYPCSR